MNNPPIESAFWGSVKNAGYEINYEEEYIEYETFKRLDRLEDLAKFFGIDFKWTRDLI